MILPSPQYILYSSAFVPSQVSVVFNVLSHCVTVAVKSSQLDCSESGVVVTPCLG
jgi:hypothetical protein